MVSRRCATLIIAVFLFLAVVPAAGTEDIPDLEEILDEIQTAEKREKAGAKSDWQHKLSVRVDTDYLSRNEASLINPDNVFDIPAWQNQFFLDYSFFARPFPSWELAGDFLLRSSSDFPENRGAEHSGDFFIKESYARWNKDNQYYASLGRLNLINGVSYFFNPIDYFLATVQEVGPGGSKSFRVDRVGTWILSGEVISDDFHITGAYAPKLESSHSRISEQLETNQQDKYLLSLQTNFFPDYNPKLLWFREGFHQLGVELTGSVTDSVVFHLEGNLKINPEIPAVEKQVLGTKNDFSLSTLRDRGMFGSDVYAELVAGLNVYLGDSITLILEYYFNQDGWTSDEFDRYIDSLIDPAGTLQKGQLIDLVNVGNMRQHYFFTRVSKNNAFTRDLNIGQNVLFSIDGSSMWTTTAEYLISDSWILNLENSFFLGSKESEFGHQFYDSITTISLEYVF